VVSSELFLPAVESSFDTIKYSASCDACQDLVWYPEPIEKPTTCGLYQLIARKTQLNDERAVAFLTEIQIEHCKGYNGRSQTVLTHIKEMDQEEDDEDFEYVKKR